MITTGLTHWRTLNRGVSWQSFNVPIPPTFGMNALGYNARRWDWIIYTGIKCEDQEGTNRQFCTEEVSSPAIAHQRTGLASSGVAPPS